MDSECEGKDFPTHVTKVC